MNLTIETKSWRYEEKDTNKKKLMGTYSVKLGDKIVATETFNSSTYSSDKEIIFPAALLAEVEALDEKVKEVIINTLLNL